MESDMSRDFLRLYEEICVPKSADNREVSFIVSYNYQVSETGITKKQEILFTIYNFGHEFH
jgi:hypothetical protein